MNWLKALGYVSYVVRASSAIMDYLNHKQSGRLANELSGVMYDAMDAILKGKARRHVDRELVTDAAKAIAYVVKDAVDGPNVK